jgi:hypothetical protein
MLWVGALFVFTPIVCVGAVLLVVWWQRRKGAEHGESPPS